MLFLTLIAAASASCFTELVKIYNDPSKYDQTALHVWWSNKNPPCPDTYNPNAAACSHNYASELDNIFDPTTAQCSATDTVTGMDICGGCKETKLTCTDTKCDSPCRSHSDCDTTTGVFLYCASIQDRVDNKNYPTLNPWTTGGSAYDPNIQLEDDPGRCRPTAECLYFHDAVGSCTSASCTPANPGSFGTDWHRVCPNLLNKNTPCTSNAECQDNTKVKGGKGFCPTTGHWRNCYEDFFCCAYKEAMMDYGNIMRDEFGGTCQQDCATHYKCPSDQVWDLNTNQCIASSGRRNLNMRAAATDDVQANLNCAKAGTLCATGSKTTTSSAYMFSAIGSLLLAFAF